jgi:NAD(P)-dependent dehydrogenase (short-subunit alcohol dehydrogenase family)
VLARDRANVVVTDLGLDACQETVATLGPGEHHAVAGDVSSKKSVTDCFQQILDKYKRAPDIIVNSAGITKDGFLLRMKEEDFDRVIDVNLKGTFLVTQAAAALMKEQKLQGSIVNIASIVGRTGNIGQVIMANNNGKDDIVYLDLYFLFQANYTASKAGVIGFTKTAAKELGKFGIRVNVILPGFIKTPMTDVVPDKVSCFNI